mmetsp:Transcript_11322/g.21380  ORF Transcript_11322/g.21380 Transcript_11322/m.21380 type:complete len:203 (+) Transcript_11322:754-1362(+)
MMDSIGARHLHRRHRRPIEMDLPLRRWMRHRGVICLLIELRMTMVENAWMRANGLETWAIAADTWASLLRNATAIVCAIPKDVTIIEGRGRRSSWYRPAIIITIHRTIAVDTKGEAPPPLLLLHPHQQQQQQQPTSIKYPSTFKCNYVIPARWRIGSNIAMGTASISTGRKYRRGRGRHLKYFVRFSMVWRMCIRRVSFIEI